MLAKSCHDSDHSQLHKFEGKNNTINALNLTSNKKKEENESLQ